MSSQYSLIVLVYIPNSRLTHPQFGFFCYYCDSVYALWLYSIFLFREKMHNVSVFQFPLRIYALLISPFFSAYVRKSDGVSAWLQCIINRWQCFHFYRVLYIGKTYEATFFPLNTQYYRHHLPFRSFVWSQEKLTVWTPASNDTGSNLSLLCPILWSLIFLILENSHILWEDKGYSFHEGAYLLKFLIALFLSPSPNWSEWCQES